VKIGFVRFFTQGVAVGLGYKWFSTICRHTPKVQYIPAQSQRVGSILIGKEF